MCAFMSHAWKCFFIYFLHAHVAQICFFIYFLHAHVAQIQSFCHCLHIITTLLHSFLICFNSRIHIYPFLYKYTYKPLCPAANLSCSKSAPPPAPKTSCLWMRIRNNHWSGGRFESETRTGGRLS